MKSKLKLYNYKNRWLKLKKNFLNFMILIWRILNDEIILKVQPKKEKWIAWDKVINFSKEKDYIYNLIFYKN